jgi:hypothetical protein
MAYYTRNDDFDVEGFDAARRIDLSVINFLSTQPSRRCHMHHP